jgi:ubiquinone/menaquinone biosynthesis C-methylase UbiE
VTAAGREAGGGETGRGSDRAVPSVPFDAVAAGYDRAMARLSEPFVPDLLAACALDASAFFLDVGTGTGLVAAAAASAIHQQNSLPTTTTTGTRSVPRVEPC